MVHINVTTARALGGAIALSMLTAGCLANQSEAATAAITVHVALFGGPATRDGGMALNGKPEAHANVTAKGSTGKTWTSTTDATGAATLHLPPGSYDVYSTYCGSEPQHISAPANRVITAVINCAVP